MLYEVWIKDRLRKILIQGKDNIGESIQALRIYNN